MMMYQGSSYRLTAPRLDFFNASTASSKRLLSWAASPEEAPAAAAPPAPSSCFETSLASRWLARALRRYRN